MIISQQKGNSKLNKDNIENEIYFFEYEDYKGRMASEDLKNSDIEGTSKTFIKCPDVICYIRLYIAKVRTILHTEIILG